MPLAAARYSLADKAPIFWQTPGNGMAKSGQSWRIPAQQRDGGTVSHSIASANESCSLAARTSAITLAIRGSGTEMSGRRNRIPGPAVGLSTRWEYDGTLWTRVADTGPSSRAAHRIIYDGAKVLLFGGFGGVIFLGDTWEWDGNHWTQLQDIGPAPRASFGMAFDTIRKHTILFGGLDKNYANLGDTWEWFDHPLPQS